jgi:hypothetical protein
MLTLKRPHRTATTTALIDVSAGAWDSAEMIAYIDKSPGTHAASVTGADRRERVDG